QLGDFFRGAVAPGFDGFGIGNSLPPLLINLVKIFQDVGWIKSARAQFLLEQWQVGPDEVQIKHGKVTTVSKRGLFCTYSRQVWLCRSQAVNYHGNEILPEDSSRWADLPPQCELE